MEKLTKPQLIEELTKANQANTAHVEQIEKFTKATGELLTEKDRLTKELFSLKADVANLGPIKEQQEQFKQLVTEKEETIRGLLICIRLLTR